MSELSVLRVDELGQNRQPANLAAAEDTTYLLYVQTCSGKHSVGSLECQCDARPAGVFMLGESGSEYLAALNVQDTSNLA
jgi:hypothetical protein